MEKSWVCLGNELLISSHTEFKCRGRYILHSANTFVSSFSSFPSSWHNQSFKCCPLCVPRIGGQREVSKEKKTGRESVRSIGKYYVSNRQTILYRTEICIQEHWLGSHDSYLLNCLYGVNGEKYLSMSEILHQINDKNE